ncbi:MAG: helix-turn-helix domain-containing protein [Micropepsaceae bacterium]
MSTKLLGYYTLPKRQRDKGQAGLTLLGRARGGDTVEINLVRADGKRQSVAIPKQAVALLRDALAKLVDSERVAVMREDAELSPEQAAVILGISRPLVVRRMTDGRLPFRYVGTHRRTRLRDVLALLRDEQPRREAQKRLAEDTEDLIKAHGL